ncbi:alpha/beta fold hydrolase [Helicobacter cappadocius]|uniref:Alpha/beta hydrolase n=1 Tax=Helicobacter cappadocius TaxID=3063998 RepID=A0AA90PHJ5_9HELI|nr:MULTISPECIES: alpha/beta hydrolase [unclassified Helicobacter]MDO7252545.1 alpha/beta hydrolase [Helicobacter sp. faydin-H75]MDP2538412.1 alpha/beta hydrolase [Helicobacter sp. faydin-H76]
MAKRLICYRGNEFELSYTFLNHHCSKNILFLHGWGSNKELMELAFKNSFKDFNHYYLDMPGFGNSPNSVVISTQDYAQITNEFIASFDIKINVIVGHSFGGKVALLCNSDEIILLSSAGIPIQKSLRVKTKIFLAKIFKTLGINSSKLRSADAENLNEAMYEVFKQVVNEDFSNIYAHFCKKAYVFWGRSDSATPLWCGEKISTLIPNNHFFVLEGDHYFFLKQAKIIDEQYHKEGR